MPNKEKSESKKGAWKLKNGIAKMKTFILMVLFLAWRSVKMLIFLSRLMLSKTDSTQNTASSKAGRQRGCENTIHINKVLGQIIGLMQVIQRLILSCSSNPA